MTISEVFQGAGVTFKAASRSVSRLLWPPACLNCGESLEPSESLCQNCWNDILQSTASTYCPRCGKDAGPYAVQNGSCPDCIGREFHFDSIARAGVYKGALQKMIVAFKAADRTDLDRHFKLLAESAFTAASFAREVDCLVPVPLHWSRRLKRGYNHAQLIARAMAGDSSAVSNDLVRIKRTKLQPSLTPDQRARNVKGAFAVRRGHPFAGKTVCLVDDVKTTGATLNECAATLKEAGAAKVYAFVIAVAGQRCD